MRTLAANLQQLVASRVLAEIPQVQITIVEDHDVPTLAPPAVFGTYPIDGGALPTLPFLKRITFPIETMSHMPAASAGAVDAFTRQILFALVNLPYGGNTSLLNWLLRNGGKLDRSLLKLSTYMLPPREFGNEPIHTAFVYEPDSSGGSVPYFDGVVDRVVSVGSEIQCIGRTLLPEIPFKQVPSTSPDFRDRGLPLPMPIGSEAIVKCVNLDLGFVATTIEQLGIGSVDVGIAVVTGTPPQSGTAMIGAEAITWTAYSGGRLTGITRAVSPTLEADWVAGTQLIEVKSLVMAVAAYPTPGVVALYIISGTTGTTIRVPTLLYSVNSADTQPPGAVGDPITTVTLSPVQLADVLQGVIADATVTQQAEYEGTSTPAQDTATDTAADVDNALVPATSGTEGVWTNVTMTPTWTFSKGSANFQDLRVSFPNGLSQAGLQGLRYARFSFDVTVNALTQTSISIGLIANNIPGVLVGVQDGSLVASIDVSATGSYVGVSGAIYLAEPGMDIEDLSPVLIDVIKGEVSGGNPSVDFTIDAVKVEYGYWEDIELQTSTRQISGNGTIANTIIGAWTGIWADTNTTSPSLKRNDGSGFKHSSEMQVLTDPWAGDPVYEGLVFDSLEIQFLASVAVTGGQGINDATARFTPVNGPWDVADSLPATTNINNIDVGGPSSSDSVFVNLKANARTQDAIGMHYEVAFGLAGDNNTGTHTITLEAKFWVKKDPFAPLPRLTDTTIQTAAGNVDLQFYATVDGPDVPNDLTNPWNGTPGDTLNHPADIARHWLETVGGYAPSDLDLPSFAEAFANLGAGYIWGFDARNTGSVWREVLARIGYEARANLVRPSGGPWKMLTAQADHTWGAPVATLDSFGELVAIGKDDREIRTRFTVYSDFDPRAGVFDTTAFFAVQTTDPTAPAVVAREQVYGITYNQPQLLRCHRVEGSVGSADWVAYQEQEYGREARIWSGRFDHWQAYPIEIGDVVTLTLEGESPKCRVIETQRDQINGIRLRLIEVL